MVNIYAYTRDYFLYVNSSCRCLPLTATVLSLVFLPMIKTNTKKKSSPKKTPAVAAKAPVAKKVAVAKSAPAKAPATKTPVPKKAVTTKKAPTKVAPAAKKAVPTIAKKTAPKKVTAPAAPKAESSSHSLSETSKEGVKMLGILHLVGNLFSGGVLGIILVIIYYFFQHEKISRLEKEACFEIINFNLSFILYM